MSRSVATTIMETVFCRFLRLRVRHAIKAHYKVAWYARQTRPLFWNTAEEIECPIQPYNASENVFQLIRRTQVHTCLWIWCVDKAQKTQSGHEIRRRTFRQSIGTYVNTYIYIVGEFIYFAHVLIHKRIIFCSDRIHLQKRKHWWRCSWVWYEISDRWLSI